MNAHPFGAKTSPTLNHLVGAREEGWAGRREARLLLGVGLRANLAARCPEGKGCLWLRLQLPRVSDSCSRRISLREVGSWRPGPRMKEGLEPERAETQPMCQVCQCHVSRASPPEPTEARPGSRPHWTPRG